MSSTRSPRPLTKHEERTWRSLVRVLVLLPRAIDEDLVRRADISLTRYVVLMRLSEAPARSLRMSHLAEAAAMSPSRMTRIVRSLVTEGLVTRERVPADGRAGLATLTDHGLQSLQAAWPEHLAGVRAIVLDHIKRDELAAFNRVIKQLLEAAEQATGKDDLSLDCSASMGDGAVSAARR